MSSQVLGATLEQNFKFFNKEALRYKILFYLINGGGRFEANVSLNF